MGKYKIMLFFLISLFFTPAFSQAWIKVAETENNNFYIQERSGEIISNNNKPYMVIVIGKSENKKNKQAETLFWYVSIQACVMGKGPIGLAAMDGTLQGEHQFTLGGSDAGSLIAGVICKAVLDSKLPIPRGITV